MPMKKHVLHTLINAEEVKARIAELARQINENYADTPQLVLIGLLRGSFIVLADLSRQLRVNHEIDFIIASSYGNDMESSREVKIRKDLDGEIAGKDVLVVEDIIDTGYTLREVTRILQLREPRSLEIFTLLDKPERREVEVPVRWVGFQIPDEFVVGMGIDYAQHYRNLDYIAKVVLED